MHFGFHNSTSVCNQPYNLHQKFSSANSRLPTPLLIAPKIILTISTNTPFFYTSALFHLPIFPYSDPYKFFPYLIHLANSGCDKGPVNKGVLWGLTLFLFQFLFLKV